MIFDTDVLMYISKLLMFFNLKDGRNGFSAATTCYIERQRVHWLISI